MTEIEREIRERFGPLWVVHLNGGPMDGHVEIHSGTISRKLYRRWYPMNRVGPPVANVYLYVLVEPLVGASDSGEVGFPAQYVLVDIQPSDQPITPTQE